MKNIHILPTPNPSCLVLETVNNNLFLTTTKSFPTNIMKFQNIYITSDEKPKQGEWSLYQNKIIKCIEDIIGDEFKKIILTTDQDLIKDGIQTIDDEFLEWFVKNQSCEGVKVYYIPNEFRYEIIIPKEEPKTDEWLSPMQKFSIRKEEPKQESLEEAKLNEKEFYEYMAKQDSWKSTGLIIQEFIQLKLKEQDKNKYSEEEVIKIVEKSRETGLTAEFLLLTEQFKKK